MKNILLVMIVIILSGCSEYQRDVSNYKYTIYGERLRFAADNYEITDGVLSFTDKKGRIIQLSSWAAIENNRG